MTMIIGDKTFSYGEDVKKPARITITNLVERVMEKKNNRGERYDETYLTVSYEFNYHLDKMGKNFQYFRHTDTVQLPIRKVTLEQFKETLRALYQQYGPKLKNAKKTEPIIVLE